MDDGTIDVMLEGRSGDAASVDLERLGPRTYRVASVPLTEGVGFRDVIEAEETEPGELKLVRVVERSGWSTTSYAVAEGAMESPGLRARLAQVEAAGGRWETLFGGLLFICLPPGAEPIDFTAP